MQSAAKRHGAYRLASHGPAGYGLLFGLCLILLTGPFGPCLAKGDGNVIAVWGKHKITDRELEARIASLPPETRQQLSSPEMVREFLESLVQVQIAAAEARSQKLDKDKAVAMRLRDMADSVLVQEYLTRKINAMKGPTDKDVEAYFKSHASEFVVPDLAKAQHILLRVDPKAQSEQWKAAEAKAEGILKELAAGADFGKLAEKYSEDPGSKAQGGDLGLFHRKQMVPEFSEAAFKLKKGEVSKPVKTAFGLHIIKLNDQIPGRPMELTEARDSIYVKLEGERKERLIKDELDRLRKKYRVRIMLPEPKPQSPVPAPAPKSKAD